MTGRPVRIVGAGLAGLSAGVALARAGVAVDISEAAAQAGGRCRSYHDPQLDMVIDNGNHLVLSGNRAVNGYLATIGAGDRLTGPDSARFAFADFGSGARWTVRINDGRLPWWIMSRGRRVPGSSLSEYLRLAKLLGGGADRRIDAAIPAAGPLWDKLTAPLLLAALNTDPAEGSSRLAGAIIRETLGAGGRACRPRIATPNLAAAFVDPAIAWLGDHGGTVKLGRRLRAFEFADDHVSALLFADGSEPVAPDAPVILAVSPWVAQVLVPGITAPSEFRAIVNAHFRMVPPAGAAPITGVIGGTAEWVFCLPDRISVTISAADRLIGSDRATLAARIWREVAAVLALPATPLPPWQIVSEKRATFAATPRQAARRPPARTRWRNLLLAGDWTDTGLPATIEGALRSGVTAADLARAAISL